MEVDADFQHTKTTDFVSTETQTGLERVERGLLNFHF